MLDGDKSSSEKSNKKENNSECWQECISKMDDGEGPLKR